MWPPPPSSREQTVHHKRPLCDPSRSTVTPASLPSEFSTTRLCPSSLRICHFRNARWMESHRVPRSEAGFFQHNALVTHLSYCMYQELIVFTVESTQHCKTILKEYTWFWVWGLGLESWRWTGQGSIWGSVSSCEKWENNQLPPRSSSWWLQSKGCPPPRPGPRQQEELSVLCTPPGSKEHRSVVCSCNNLPPPELSTCGLCPTIGSRAETTVHTQTHHCSEHGKRSCRERVETEKKTLQEGIGLAKKLTQVSVCVCALSCFSRVHSFWPPSGSSVHGCSRQEYWSGSPCRPPGDLSDPGVEPTSALQVDSLLTEPPGKQQIKKPEQTFWPTQYFWPADSTHNLENYCKENKYLRAGKLIMTVKMINSNKISVITSIFSFHFSNIFLIRR